MHGPPNSVKKTQQQQYLHAIIPLIALRGSHIPRYRYSQVLTPMGPHHNVKNALHYLLTFSPPWAPTSCFTPCRPSPIPATTLTPVGLHQLLHQA